MSTHLSWKILALKSLSNTDAPRVFGRTELVNHLQDNGIDVPLRTLLRALSEWETAQLVERVAQGVYLNKQQNLPMVSVSEAAFYMRPDSVLSLHHVLGNAGVLNNPTAWITSVLPLGPIKNTLNVELENGVMLKLAYMDPDFFHPSLKQDALEPFSIVPTATPEKALLDLLHLSSSPRGAKRWTLPPAHDWDLEMLDTERLRRLANQLNMEGPLDEFQQGIENSVRVKIPRRVKL